jgi:hypothetical protein
MVSLGSCKSECRELFLFAFEYIRGSFELAAGIAGQMGVVPLAVHGIYAATAGLDFGAINFDMFSLGIF